MPRLTRDSWRFRVYDWEQNRRLSRFSNGDPAKGSITSLKFINEDDAAFLLTGSCESTEAHVVSSRWRGLMVAFTQPMDRFESFATTTSQRRSSWSQPSVL